MKVCNQAENLDRCNCTYEPCSRKGLCCECLQFHWSMRELPACLFPDDVEKTYDRSVKRFIALYKDQI